jgi:hypothetical protein
MLMSNSARPAHLHYMANGFRVLTPGDHVTCAVSGARVALEDLRYWSIALQQPYATAEIATQAMLAK